MRVWYLTEVTKLESEKVAERVGGRAASAKSLLRLLSSGRHALGVKSNLLTSTTYRLYRGSSSSR